MRKSVKFLLLGAAVGGAAVAIKSVQAEEPMDDVAAKAAKVAGSAALGGAVVGWLFDRRARRKAKRRVKLASAAGLVEAAKAGWPVLEKKSRRTRKAAVKAAGKAAVKAGQAAEAARPMVEQAAGMAKGQATRLADVGRQKLAS